MCIRDRHEVKDVVAVCEFVQTTLQHSVILVGSSAGAASSPRLLVCYFVSVHHVVGSALSCATQSLHPKLTKPVL